MKKIAVLIIALCSIIFASCIKGDSIDNGTTSFVDLLAITGMQVPAFDTAGTPISCGVSIRRYNLYGNLKLQRFDIKEVSPKKFEIKAFGLFENWSPNTPTNRDFSLDTTVHIPTTASGIYNLNFFNGTDFTSFSVQVN